MQSYVLPWRPGLEDAEPNLTDAMTHIASRNALLCPQSASRATLGRVDVPIVYNPGRSTYWCKGDLRIRKPSSLGAEVDVVHNRRKVR